MAVGKVGDGSSRASGADEASQTDASAATQSAEAAPPEDSIAAGLRDLAHDLAETVLHPSEEQTKHSWEAFARDSAAAALQGKIEYKANGNKTGKFPKVEVKAEAKEGTKRRTKTDSLSYTSDKGREELKLESKTQKGRYTSTDTVEIKSGPKTDSSKWDKPSDKIEGGKFTRTRETKYTDKDEVSVKHDESYELKKPADKELTKKLEERAKKLQEGGDILANVFGIKKEWKSDKHEAKAEAPLVKFKNTSADGKTETEGFMGARATASAESKASIGADGIKGEAKAEARAGLYEEIKGKTSGEWGSAEGSMGAKAEVYATAKATGKLDVNGLEVKAKAEVGAEISANVHGKYTTPAVKIGGQDVTASVEANGRAALEAKASAEGTVAITRDPPKAIIEGKAGASAVAKLEGDVTASGGPFSVKASGYVSAGAEAQASASLGYDDGKLKFSFGAGAALGLGAGGKVEFQVDLKQIKDIGVGLAKEALDVDGDGELGMSDVKAAGQAVVKTAEKAIDSAVDTVADAAHDAVDTAKDTLKAGAAWVGGLFD